MRRRGIATLIATVVMASAIAVPVAAQDETVLRTARLSDGFNQCHPVNSQTGNQMQWWGTIFNWLVKLESDSRTVVPDLATSWESDDAQTYIFNLVDNATWHDGEPFTAEDVVYTVQWGIDNVNSYQGYETEWKNVESVEAIDDHTVRITLNAPNSLFLGKVTAIANVILPAHALADATPDNILDLPFALCTPGVTIGTGPYTLEDFQPSQIIEVAANPDYFKGAPNIDRIIFKDFADPALAIAQIESGELDLVFRVPPDEQARVSNIEGLALVPSENPGIVRIVVATEKAQWSDPKFRHAMSAAINRNGIVDGLYQGNAKVLHNHPGFEVTDTSLSTYDPDRARELLAEIGYGGETFKILYDASLPENQASMPLIQSDLQAVGIPVELVPTPGTGEFVDKLFTYVDAEGRALDDEAFDIATASTSEYDGFMHIGGTEALHPDVSNTYYRAPTDTHPKWLSGYNSDKIQDLWAAGRATVDPDEQAQIYGELGSILYTDMPMVHLFVPNIANIASDCLGGTFDIHLSERESFMDVDDWEWTC